MRAAFGLALLLLALPAALACASKPIDPLAADRARLLALDDEPLPSAWQSEATLFVGEGLLSSQLQAALDDASGEAARHPGFDTPLGLLQVTPKGKVSMVRVAPSATCETCVEVTAAIEGTMEGFISGPFGTTARELPFSAEATSTFELALIDDDEARRALLRPVRGGQWAAEAEVFGLPPALNLALSDLLQQQVELLVTRGFLPELPLVEVPRDGDVRVRGMRARTLPLDARRHVVAVELGFVTLERGPPPPPIDAEEGFVVAVPFETLRGLARAAALRAPPQDGYVADPLAIRFEEDRFVLDVRVWKIAPEPVARDFRAEGRVVVADGVLSVVPERVTALGDAPLLDPMELFVRAAMESALEKGLAAMVPARQEGDLALGRKLAVELTRIEGREGVLVLKGRVVLVKPGDA